jgi:Flp pilus assembly protein TadB
LDMLPEFSAAAQRMGTMMPGLAQELDDAGMGMGGVEYLAKGLTVASATALVTFASCAAAFIIGGTPRTDIPAALSLAAFGFVLFMHVKRPGHVMRLRSRRIEESLVYNLHAINIETKAGIRFSDALRDIVSMDCGEFSKEMSRVLSDAEKYGLKHGLERSARRNPSKAYRRAVWQLVNSLETGADIRSNLDSITEDLRRRQEEEAHRYGRTMEKQMVLYVMGGIVLPAMAAVVIQSASTLGASGGIGGERTYWAILAASVAVQAAFLFLIKFSKPALLCEPMPKSAGRINPTAFVKELLSHSGIETPAGKYLFSRALICVAAALALTFAFKPFTQLGYPHLFALSACLSFATGYAYLSYLADRRGLLAAEHLPDALRMMAANMEAGIASDQAIFMSARPEFGILGEEIRHMGTDMIKNLTFQEALERLKMRIRSAPLHLSVNLIGHGLRSGRGLPESLFRVAFILQDREHARQSVATRLSAVRGMVLILVLVSGPVLYGCSMVAGSMMADFNGRIEAGMPPGATLGSAFKHRSPAVTLEFLDGFFMTSLLASSILGAAIVGEATTGKAKEGLRYMLIMAFISEGLYLASKTYLAVEIRGAFA